MKTRAKNKQEKFHDDNAVAHAKAALADHAVVYFNEHQELNDTMHRTFTDARDSAWEYEHVKEIAAMPKVGDEWDYSKGITGAYRYHDL
jgi:hypothetical protein